MLQAPSRRVSYDLAQAIEDFLHRAVSDDHGSVYLSTDDGTITLEGNVEIGTDHLVYTVVNAGGRTERIIPFRRIKGLSRHVTG